MKKILLICLIVQACTVNKVPKINVENPKILIFVKHSNTDNHMNKAKLKNWKNSFQKRFPNLCFVGKSYNVESSLSFNEQLDIRKKETNPKYIITYEFMKAFDSRNRYVFVLSDKKKKIKDKVYNNAVFLRIKEVENDFNLIANLE